MHLSLVIEGGAIKRAASSLRGISLHVVDRDELAYKAWRKLPRSREDIDKIEATEMLFLYPVEPTMIDCVPPPPTKLKGQKREFTEPQRAWNREFEEMTSFDVMNDAEYLLGEISWPEFQRLNIQWFEDHNRETTDFLERTVGSGWTKLRNERKAAAKQRAKLKP